MSVLKDKIRKVKYEKGFNLIELIIVIAILGIISAVLVPSLLGTTERAKKKVCSVNSIKAEKMYEIYLYEEGEEHSKIIFDKYVQQYEKDICPDSGIVTYEDRKIKCSIHSLGRDDEQNNGDVPYI